MGHKTETINQTPSSTGDAEAVSHLRYSAATMTRRGRDSLGHEEKSRKLERVGAEQRAHTARVRLAAGERPPGRGEGRWKRDTSQTTRATPPSQGMIGHTVQCRRIVPPCGRDDVACVRRPRPRGRARPSRARSRTTRSTWRARDPGARIKPRTTKNERRNTDTQIGALVQAQTCLVGTASRTSAARA